MQFFERQFPDLEQFKILYRPVLEVIAAAREPLELDYLAALFGWSDYDKLEMLDAFGSLLPETDGRINPFHQSVLDWLTEKSRSGPYFISIREGLKRLADYGWREYRSGVANMARYSLVHLPSHLSDVSNRQEDLRGLLFDFGWMQAKLGVAPMLLR